MSLFSASSIYAVIIRAPYEHLPAQIPHPAHFSGEKIHGTGVPLPVQVICIRLRGHLEAHSAHPTHSSGMIHGSFSAEAILSAPFRRQILPPAFIKLSCAFIAQDIHPYTCFRSRLGAVDFINFYTQSVSVNPACSLELVGKPD